MDFFSLAPPLPLAPEGRCPMSKPSEATIAYDGPDLFVFVDGIKIAKRGHPETPEAGTWISLEPGFAVYDDPAEGSITIEFNGERTPPH
jgi:hypothetical protein